MTKGLQRRLGQVAQRPDKDPSHLELPVASDSSEDGSSPVCCGSRGQCGVPSHLPKYSIDSPRTSHPCNGHSLGLGVLIPTKGPSVGGMNSLMKVGAMSRNSWRFVFEGTIYQDGAGTRLAGTLGPNAFIPVFSAIWIGFVSLFLIVGFVGFVSNLATGHGASLAPFVLIPLLMLTMFVGISEVGTRSARLEWHAMERWLRTLIEVPPDTSRS